MERRDEIREIVCQEGPRQFLNFFERGKRK
jgi:hypothetical protein